MLLQESRRGKHEGSISSTQTIDSLSTNDRKAWRAIRKELQDMGISITAFEANQDFIMNWFKAAISAGAFDEQAVGESAKSLDHDGVRSQPLQDSRHDTVS